MSAPLRAQLFLRCCGTTRPVRTSGPCWQVFVAVPGRVDQWPTHTWPTREAIPSVEQRREALAGLGFEPVPGAEWDWVEDTGPEYHPHPAQVVVMAAIKVRPTETREVTR